MALSGINPRQEGDCRKEVTDPEQARRPCGHVASGNTLSVPLNLVSLPNRPLLPPTTLPTPSPARERRKEWGAGLRRGS